MAACQALFQAASSYTKGRPCGGQRGLSGVKAAHAGERRARAEGPALFRGLTMRTRAPAVLTAASAAASAAHPPQRQQHNRHHHRTHHTPPAADLAVYHFSQRRIGTAAEWFQAAVRGIVKQVDRQAPFLQTVQLGVHGAPPRLATYGVQDPVVAAPELWQGIAEHVSRESPDVVILVQRVSPHASGSPQGAMDAAEAEKQQRQQQQGGTPGGGGGAASSSSVPGSSRSPHLEAEEACRRLVSSGLADAILQGQVGDCCDGSGHHHHHSHGHEHDADCCGGAAAADKRQQQQAARPLPLPAIVPFSPAGGGSPLALPRRTAVRAAALRPPGAPGPDASGGCQHSACYWGVVVQSQQHTGTEGCYLLKTVKNVSGTGCSCTHFSLTRISAGEHLEQQFVQSWLL